jgi:tellurite methyltransferase
VADDWGAYYDAATVEPRGTLLDAADRFGDAVGEAVDLGCGTGRDTFELLRRGWRVLAIDASADGIARLRSLAGADTTRLRTEVARMEDATWPEVQLVTSSFALPFCPPDRFEAVWSRIVDSLPTGGRFCGHLFGDRDAWVGESGITFLGRDRLEQLLRPFVLESFSEIEEDGKTALGAPKHWHVFHVVARKRQRPYRIAAATSARSSAGVAPNRSIQSARL